MEATPNKRPLGPWITHLRMMFIKGKRKQSFPLSPAMNLNRSAISLRLYMEKFPYIMLTKLTCKD